ncbi:TOBE domain-containing protein [Polaromonas sp. CG_9.11]|uniref:TOBE domain-containing protein n=1 Tax=Polaromonas sp. CG_9.11 TaxID=2787730 RepID=UPI0018CA7E50|nr:TOBE domain-containing protein [Polaromonas sp. CG_9.11]MBG6074355.1 molybdate transport system regulatory protein [Polaromonas sp. CG_9.11]
MKKSQLQLAGALGHEAADKRIDILRRIGETGSISQAARAAGVSYKAGWQAIDTLSNLAGVALVERVVGGAGGGGARLSDAGRELLRAADELAQARAQVLARLASEAGHLPKSSALAALGLRTSLRNQLPCTLLSLHAQGQAVRVQLRLAGGMLLSSRITRESAQLLALCPGQPVLALCKATAVKVSAGDMPAEAGNWLHGRATRVSRAAGGGEVALELAGGLQLVGFCDADSGLKAGRPALAFIDESAVVVAVAG